MDVKIRLLDDIDFDEGGKCDCASGKLDAIGVTCGFQTPSLAPALSWSKVLFRMSGAVQDVGRCRACRIALRTMFLALSRERLIQGESSSQRKKMN